MITHLRSVALATPEPSDLVEFYERIWGLHRVEVADGVTYLRGTGDEHHIVEVHPGSQAAVRGYCLGLPDRDSVDRAADRLAASSHTSIVTAPRSLDRPGGGYGLAIADPDGREVELVASVAPAPSAVHDSPVMPVKVSHVVVNSPNPQAYAGFLTDALGFRLADETEFMQFWKCNLDHHSVAVTRAPHASLNHVAFEVPTLDDVLFGIEHMGGHGFETLWGPGRHPQGMNVFGYFESPSGQVVEYTAEIEQIEDDDLAPRMWVPDDYEVYDDWADVSSLRPTPETREIMLGRPEAALHPVEPAGGGV